MRFNGKPLDLSRSTNADDRRDAGLAHVPEDRHRRGLVMPFAEWENSCFGYQREARFDGPLATLDRDRHPRPRARRASSTSTSARRPAT